MFKSTLEVELEDILNPKEKEDTLEWVKEEELEKVECHLKYFGSEDKES